MKHASPVAQKPDLAGVRTHLAGLLSEGKQDQALEMIVTMLDQMAEQNTQLQWRLQAALRQLYRKKSERISSDQLSLLLSQLSDEDAAKAEVETALPATPAVPDADGSAPDGPAAPPRPAPRGHGRKPLPPGLRRETREIPLAPEDTICAECGREMKPIGSIVVETLEFKPAEFFVIEERRQKLACSKCHAGVAVADATPKPIDGARPGPGLLAQIVTSKFDDSCPLHRQAKIYARSGIHISTSTLGDWCAAAAEMLAPLYRFAKRLTLNGYLVSVDDTGMPVLDRDDPRGIKRGHIWTYVGNVKRAMFCEYTPDWKGEAPQSVLAGFKGIIQGDGYAGFEKLFVGPDPPIRAGCVAHMRRKFVLALEAGDPQAAVPLSLIGKLYAIEAKAREDGVDLDELRRRRQALSRPVMNQLGRVIADLHKTALPKSPMGKAITYAVNQWQTLQVFLDDGRVPLDNTHVERLQRPTAMGRRNYLFCGSDEGARRAAIVLTVLGNCALHGVQPFEYLTWVFDQLSTPRAESRVGDLMPDAYLASKKAQ